MARILADGQRPTSPQVPHSMDRQNFGERQLLRRAWQAGNSRSSRLHPEPSSAASCRVSAVLEVAFPSSIDGRAKADPSRKWNAAPRQVGLSLLALTSAVVPDRSFAAKGIVKVRGHVVILRVRKARLANVRRSTCSRARSGSKSGTVCLGCVLGQPQLTFAVPPGTGLHPPLLGRPRRTTTNVWRLAA